MIRSELVQCLVEDDLGQEAAHAIVATFFNEIANRLAAGGRVELRGFGVFTTRVRDPRVGRDPRTGESVEVTAKRVRSEEHTSELQSLMRISYAVFCLKKTKQRTNKTCNNIH